MNMIYQNLLSQLDKLYRHNRQGSFKTKERYYEAMKRFCRFLAETYRLEKLANIGPKHIHAYVDHMKAKGLSASTIKTDLGAIRFYHDKLSEPRNAKLPVNRELNLERRSFGQRDRTWSEAEFIKMVQTAEQYGKSDYAAVLYLARHADLRIHECFRIDTATARNAIKTMQLTVKGKGGKVRSVPIGMDIHDLLYVFLEGAEPGGKLFVPDGIPTHTAITCLQQFIIEHRDKIVDDGATVPISLHGLRHTFAVEQYRRFLRQGLNEQDAKRAVSKLLGHNRPEVTNIYLASLKGGDGDA